MSTISGTINYGISVTGAYASPLTITNTGSVNVNGTSTTGVYGDTAGDTVVNQGQIAGYVGGYGGKEYGINLRGTNSQIINSGTITSRDDGISLYAGGSISNTSTGTIAASYGVRGSGGATGVYNAGRISGTGIGGTGVYLQDGGSVTNTGTGLISGVAAGIRITGTLGTVTNYSSIASGGTGIYLLYGGIVNNGNGTTATASIVGYNGGVRIGDNANTATGTVVNFGTIEATGTFNQGYGVEFSTYGTVTNAPSALIEGYYWGIEAGINADSPGSTVTNYGTIEATSAVGEGIYLESGGTVVNGVSGATTGLISGGDNGIYIGRGTGIVSNYGTVTGMAGAGIYVKNTYTYNDTVTNAGTIAGGSGQDAVAFGGGDDTLVVIPSAVFTGTVDGGGGTNTLELASAATTGTIGGIGSNYVNFGTVTVDSGARWKFSGYNEASVTLNSGAYLDNAGHLTGTNGYFGIVGTGGTVDIVNTGNVSYYGGTGSAVYLEDGGTVTNSGTSAYIYGPTDGVNIIGAGGTVSNDGTIIGHTGIQLAAGGSVANMGTGAYISGREYSGIYIGGGSGTVTNQGIIDGGYGVQFGGTDGATLTNAGAIIGFYGYAVLFGDGDNRLIVDPGAVFYGVVQGGTGSNTLELASSSSIGTISGIGASYQNFGTVTVDPGAQWAIYYGATASYLVNNGTLTGQTILTIDPGTMVNNGYVGLPVALDTDSYLDNTATGTIASVYNAVYGYGAGVSVGNAGTITSTNEAGIILYYGGNVGNNGGSAHITGYVGIAIYGAPGYVTNSGTITGTGNGIYGQGVILGYGGDVTNTGSAAQISGYDGVVIYGGPGTVTNSGTVTATGAYGIGVAVAYGGAYSSVVNSDATARITGAVDGVLIALGTVTNYGTIIGEDNSGVDIAYGDVTNLGTAALISGYRRGIYVAYFGTVTNFGTITASYRDGIDITSGSVINDGSIGGAYVGIVLAHGGYINNAGLITGDYLGVGIANGPGTVINTGTIQGMNGHGVYFRGNRHNTLINSGTIIAAPGYDAVLFKGGNGRLVDDPGAVFTGAVEGGGGTLELASSVSVGTITGIGVNYVDFQTILVDAGADWTLAGADTIGNGVSLIDDGQLTVGSLTNYGSVTGSGTFTVELGNVANYGYVGLTAALHSGYLRNAGTISVASGNAVYGTGGGVTVVNAATIASGGGDAVKFSGAGNILVDEPGAVFTGTVDGGGGTLELASAASTGTITGLGTSFVDFTAITVAPGADWTLSGPGTIGSGVSLTDDGQLVVDTLTNDGSVSGSGMLSVVGGLTNDAYLGVTTTLQSGSYLDNTGTISVASGNAVYGSGGVTVVNAGTIASGGGDAVEFAGAGNALVVDPGAGFTGMVGGGGGTLELGSAASAGTIGGLGTSFVDFTTITVEPGADWTLSGPATIGSGVSLTDNGRLTAGSLTNDGSVSGSGMLSVVGGLTNDAYLGVTTTLQSSSYLDNTGTISVASGNAVYGSGGVTVVNAGTIASGGGDAVEFAGAGNALVVDPGAVFGGTVDGSGGTLELAAAASAGTIGGLGTNFVDFGTITVDAGAQWALSGANTIGNGVTLIDLGALTNDGSVSGSGMLSVVGGLTNDAYLGVTTTLQSGSYLDNTGTISVASGNAVYGSGGVTVVNAGTIASGGGDAVEFAGAGNALVVDPGAGFTGMVDGGGGTLELAAAASAGTIGGLGTNFVDFGTITVDAGAHWTLSGANTIGNGVTLADLGVLTNTGSLSGSGLFTVDPAMLINSGYIGLMPTLQSGSYLDNTGTISVASGNAVYGSGGVTVVNAGTIASGGGNAVKFAGAGNVLVVDPGAVFGGPVDGGGGTLELASAASTGTITGLGTSFVDFNTITVEPGADWQLAGTITNGTTLTMLSGATVSGAIDFAGTDNLVLVNGPDLASYPDLAFDATIYGFLPDTGDTIGLGGVSAGSFSPARLMSGHILDVGANDDDYQFQLDPAQSYAGDYFVESYNSGSGVLGVTVATVPIPNDFTGDGQSDLLMTDTNTGVLVVGEVSGGAAVNYTQIGGLGPEWQFEGTGSSLPGDGNEGFLLWNSTPGNGTIVVGEDDDGTAQYTAVGGVGPEWQFEGNGPLLGQANDDFLLWDGNSATPEYGALVIGSVSGGAAQYTQVGGVGPEWQFEGIGDYSGNGSASFLIWDTSSTSSQYGALVVGEDEGGTAQYTRIGGLGPEWQFEGSGNLLGHGQEDFLIWDGNSSSAGYGALFVGEALNGQAQYTQIGSVGPEWQFLGVGDYDGASASEFLMRNSNTGALVVGTVSNGTATYTQVGGVGPEWNFHANNPATLV